MENSDCFVVKKGRLFLMGTEEMDGKKHPVWSQYKYDAWMTMNIFAARRIARILGGNVFVFNPITGDVG